MKHSAKPLGVGFCSRALQGILSSLAPMAGAASAPPRPPPKQIRGPGSSRAAYKGPVVFAMYLSLAAGSAGAGVSEESFVGQTPL